MQQKSEETPISRFSVRAKEKQVKNSFALFLRQALIILKLGFRCELKLNKMNQHLGIIFYFKLFHNGNVLNSRYFKCTVS